MFSKFETEAIMLAIWEIKQDFFFFKNEQCHIAVQVSKQIKTLRDQDSHTSSLDSVSAKSGVAKGSLKNVGLASLDSFT